jgi:hypothetical protein
MSSFTVAAAGWPGACTVHEIARPPGGQRVQRRQRQPGQQGAADTHPMTVRRPGDEFGQGDLRDLATRYARRLSYNRVTHVIFLPAKIKFR